MMTRFETAKCITYKNCPSKCAQCEESKYAHHMPKRYLSFYKIFFLIGHFYSKVLSAFSFCGLLSISYAHNYILGEGIVP